VTSAARRGFSPGPAVRPSYDGGMPDRAAPAILRTERLTLRRPIPTDVHAILAIHADPRAYAHNPSDALATLEEAEGLLARWRDHWERHGFGYWVVVRATDPSTPIGFCGLKSMRLHDRRVLNLFYRLDPSAWGDGAASEAATRVVAWARESHPEVPTVARVRPANAASHRVAVRAGLRRMPELDTTGEDGLDWIYAANWST